MAINKGGDLLLRSGSGRSGWAARSLDICFVSHLHSESFINPFHGPIIAWTWAIPFHAFKAVWLGLVTLYLYFSTGFSDRMQSVTHLDHPLQTRRAAFALRDANHSETLSYVCLCSPVEYHIFCFVRMQIFVQRSVAKVVRIALLVRRRP
jgi:hypothetical protein